MMEYIIRRELLWVTLVLCCVGPATAFNAFIEPNCATERQGGPIVHLFEWKWLDVAKECERFLSKNGFCGVQVSPPTENRIVDVAGVGRPWWERYQPVSYRLETRSGDEAEFRAMLDRCNAVGVRVYVDIVINHMADGYTTGVGTGGSSYDGEKGSFPDVPYEASNFNTKSKCGSFNGEVNNYQNAAQVRNCRLLGLIDLDQSNPTTVGTLVDLMNRLIDWGVAGFRIDAAKHVWPLELNAILRQLHTLPTKHFPANTEPFIFQEVIYYQGSSEPISSDDYRLNGRVTEFTYGLKLSRVVRRQDRLKYLQNFGEGWAFIKEEHALVFVDNHDTQRGDNVFDELLTFHDSRQYQIAVAFMLSWPYGIPRVMSSFYFSRAAGGTKWRDIGPPSDAGDNISSPGIDAEEQCTGGWVCEHRWTAIAQMASWRVAAGGRIVDNWWDNGYDAIAFSRGGRAFIAINNEASRKVNEQLQTGLPPGRYCDVITGGRISTSSCRGEIVTVDSTGHARLSIDPSDSRLPIVAIHVNAKLND